MAKLPELTNLQDLFVEGENFSEYYLRKTNCLQPCLLFIGTEGAHLYVPELSTDLDALDTFVQHAALLCLAHAATISLLILPGATSDDDEPTHAGDRAAETLPKLELAVLLGEAPTGPHKKALTIVRSDNGRFFGFGEEGTSGTSSLLETDLAILPAKTPDAETRQRAQAIVKQENLETFPLIRE